MDLVDHYGGTMLIFFLAVVEMAVIAWLYGLEDWCHDVEFMVQRRVGLYWRLCWGLITPLFMIVVFLYSLSNYKWPTYSGRDYPAEALICGVLVFLVGISQVIIWGAWTLTRTDSVNMDIWTRIQNAAKSSLLWGPCADSTRKAWLQYKKEAKARRKTIMQARNHSKIISYLFVLLGLYDDFVPIETTKL